MATKAALRAAIQGDLHRTDVDTQIDDAITAAVKHYSRIRFWFLEGSYTFSTSASVAEYSTPSDLKKVDTMLVRISSSWVPVHEVHYEEIDEKDSGLVTGTPFEWAYYADQWRLYPPPNDSYAVKVSYHKSLDAPSDNASNAWTNAAFDLIRHRATWDVSYNYLKNDGFATRAKNSEIDAYNSVMGENTRRMSTGKVRKTSW